MVPDNTYLGVGVHDDGQVSGSQERRVGTELSRIPQILGLLRGTVEHGETAGHAVGYAGAGGAGAVGGPVTSTHVVVGQTHHSYTAGAPVVENHVEYGIVGQRTVQSGHQQIVDGHAYAVAGQDSIPQPAHSYVVGEAKKISRQSTAAADTKLYLIS